ncbi:hypothetical protein MCHI_002547 [Candidatus Magnetoovum chiemensis]|nr:hypothetical protein MCHI_002547 [Candidatus Magnetoovum chiemensis]
MEIDDAKHDRRLNLRYRAERDGTERGGAGVNALQSGQNVSQMPAGRLKIRRLGECSNSILAVSLNLKDALDTG